MGATRMPASSCYLLVIGPDRGFPTEIGIIAFNLETLEMGEAVSDLYRLAKTSSGHQPRQQNGLDELRRLIFDPVLRRLFLS